LPRLSASGYGLLRLSTRTRPGALKIFAGLSAFTLIFAGQKSIEPILRGTLLLLSGFSTFLVGLLATWSSKENFETMLGHGVISEIDKVKSFGSDVWSSTGGSVGI